MSEVQPHLPITPRSRSRRSIAVDQPPALSQALYIGQSIDLTSAYRLPDALAGVNPLDPSKSGTKIFRFQGVDFTIPDYVDGIENPSAQIVEDSVNSRDAYQNSIAANADAELNVGAFSGQMSVSYGREYASSSDYSFAYRNFYLTLATLEMRMDEALEARSAGFITDVGKLPATTNDLEPFERFFGKYGYYVVRMVNLGGALEYSVAVSDTAAQSTTDIAANMKLEYNSFFTSGSMSASVTDSSSWQSYSSNRHVQINMLGGDPNSMSNIVKVADDGPSPSTVDAYDGWVNSVTKETAATHFKLAGIWALAPEKSDVLQEAYSKIRHGLRPKLTVEASATVGVFPTIVLDQRIVPPDPVPEGHDTGFQVAVLDRDEISSKGVVFSKYYTMKKNHLQEYDEYGRLWQRMVDDLNTEQFSRNGEYVLILATIGFDYSMPPVQQLPEYSAYSFLRGAGAGDKLVDWVNLIGELGSNSGSFRVTYILVSVMGIGSGTGAEALVYSDEAETASKQVFFYHERRTSLATLSDGGPIDGAAGQPDLRHVRNVRGARQIFVPAA